MKHYEYKIIPAPSKPAKIAGVKGAEARFAAGLEMAVNDMAADGWEYQRADILPSTERQGLTSTQTVYRSVLVFRRVVEAEEMADDATVPVVEEEAEEIVEAEENVEADREVEDESSDDMMRGDGDVEADADDTRDGETFSTTR